MSVCGIIGYVGNKPAVEILKDALPGWNTAVTIQQALLLLVVVKSSL